MRTFLICLIREPRKPHESKVHLFRDSKRNGFNNKIPIENQWSDYPLRLMFLDSLGKDELLKQANYFQSNTLGPLRKPVILMVEKSVISKSIKRSEKKYK